MPTTFRRFAVDFDGDGRRNTVGSVADMMASTANKLRKDGWVSGSTWGYEVDVPKGFDLSLADRSNRKSLRRVVAARPQARRRTGVPSPDDSAFLLMPAGAQGPAFLMVQNFQALMRYNPAEAYAIAIGHLADRLRGGGPFAQSLAAARAGAVARRAARASGEAEQAGPRHRRHVGPDRTDDARGGAQLPALGRLAGGWLRQRLGPGAAAPVTRPAAHPKAEASTITRSTEPTA